MNFRPAVKAWNSFFFTPQSPVPLCLFRIFYGLLVTATLVLLYPDWLSWFGPHSWMTLSTMRQVEPGPRLNIFTVIPQTDGWVQAVFWIALLAAICLTVGLLTRVNTVIVYVCLASIQQRNLYMTHGGDAFLRIAGFFLIFAPAGAAFSIDRLIRIRRGREGPEIQPRRPWAQRMIQFQLAMLYFAAFCTKLKGAPWLQGTALLYVYNLEELRRLPMPQWFLQPAILKLVTWASLAVEFSLGVLIWIRRLRYYVLAAGLLFHLGIEYSLNIPLFEWDVLSAYILFVDAKDIERLVAALSWGPRRNPGVRARPTGGSAADRGVCPTKTAISATKWSAAG